LNPPLVSLQKLLLIQKEEVIVVLKGEDMKGV